MKEKNSQCADISGELLTMIEKLELIILIKIAKVGARLRLGLRFSLLRGIIELSKVLRFSGNYAYINHKPHENLA